MTATAGLVALLVLVGPAQAHPSPGAEDYLWLEPPPGVEQVEPPRGRNVDVPPELLAAGRTDVWTPDMQALVTVEGQGHVPAALVPVPVSAHPAPVGLEVSGNAYRVMLGDGATSAVVTLVPPHPTTTVLRWDGAQWHPTEVAPGPDRQVSAPWDGPGPYVAAAPRLDGHANWLDAMAHGPGSTVLGSIALGLVLLDRLRLRRRRARAHPAPQGG